MSKPLRITLKILLPILVLLLALTASFWLINTRQKPARTAKAEMAVVVDVMTVAQQTRRALVRVAGTVIAARNLELRPQVSGRVMEVHPNLQPGGLVSKEDVLFTIERRDYEIEMNRMKAQVEQARFEVTQEEGRRAIAEREWSLLGDEVEATPEGRELALRIPHLRRAKAALEAAESALARAELDLERTTVRASFDGLVLRESLEIGQIVNPQTVAAVLAGTDEYWVQASVPTGALTHFAIPSPTEEGTTGARARILHQTTDGGFEKEGRVLRLLGGLEEAGRMARVLISVIDPLGIQSAEQRLPLLLDTFVEVEIEGREFADIYAIPAESLREGNRLWVMNADARLEIRKTTVLRRGDNEVWIREGLSPGERLITSRIGTPVPGLKLRLADSEDNVTSTASKEAEGE